ncbi:L-rhamnose/proton symporter RhaT [Saccharicrinis fermentans]|uniref:L-rhamnose-H(+) transport protein n=1 Tax=Saccharicrinis fermentans DSM 9555 = JCM 21142 TaxID=869213 RepID=W7YHW1_9BACT|nr:L-rhamnose/proton symporter RhaT [Saccharicrinis fermentans]GAF02144.1 L-rhamnose-H(+) transport protein [Saccharicrinis fermentans DSM 9555 = JCM 21142]
MEFAFIPLLLVLFASIFQGSFGLGMKFMSPLKWEAWWFVHATVAMIIVPVVWALIVVPDLFQVIAKAPSQAIIIGMLFGFLWGIGGIMFGKSIPYIGISLTYGIVMGTCSAVGSLIPFFQIDNAISLPAFPYVIVGVVIMLFGVAVSAYAGIKRDKLIGDTSGGKINLNKGIAIALVSGVLSAFLNVGFVNAQSVGIIAESVGALPRNSSLAVWVVVLMGAYLMNAGYAIFLLAKNKTWSSFAVSHSSKAYVWSIVAGLLWFGALGIYGQGATLMGGMGPVIGWPILLGVSLIVSNVWAYINNEWKGAKVPFIWLLAGLFILIVATVVLGYANGVN